MMLRAIADWFTDIERWHPFPPPWIWIPIAVWVALVTVCAVASYPF